MECVGRESMTTRMRPPLSGQEPRLFLGLGLLRLQDSHTQRNERCFYDFIGHSLAPP